MFYRKSKNPDNLPSTEARMRGDKARDERDWADAVNYYDQYLRSRPKDFGIWVQKGNCAKEAQQFSVALEAYDKAIAINAKDPDVFVQRGHAYKLSGRRAEAIKSYRQATSLDPDFLPALKELSILGVRTDQIAGTHKPFHVDVTDLLFYLRAHLNVSGIQRVIISFIRSVYADRKAKPFSLVSFVTVDWATQRVIEIDISDLMKVVDVVTSATKTRAQLDGAIDACSASRTAQFKRGDVYFIIGAFWVSPSYERVLIDLKEQGVLTSVYIYDLIPVAHRKFVTRELADGFTKNLYELTPLCDFAFAISEFVAGEYRAFARQNFDRDMPVTAVKLAHEVDGVDADDSFVSQSVQDLTQDRYVLCVGTIETRKNHQYLINAWRKLIEEGLTPPNLVIVGRWGWRVQDLREQLEESDYLQGKVIVLDSVSDPDLAYLYSNCEFSTFPSFVEGWGLPVGESLAYGRPCVASHTSSIPEVGGDFVRYIDPNDLNSGVAVFRELCTNPTVLKDWSDRIKKEFRPVLWADVARNLCDALENEMKGGHSRRSLVYYKARSGSIAPIGHELRDRMIKSDLSLGAAPLIRIKGWHPVESWGSWSRSRTSSIRFGTTLPEGSRITVGLKVRLPGSGAAVVKVLSSGDYKTEFSGLPLKGCWKFITAMVKEGGSVEVTFNCVGDVMLQSEETRPLYLGLEAFGYAALDGVEERFSLLQEIIAFEGSH